METREEVLAANALQTVYSPEGVRFMLSERRGKGVALFCDVALVKADAVRLATRLLTASNRPRELEIGDWVLRIIGASDGGAISIATIWKGKLTATLMLSQDEAHAAAVGILQHAEHSCV